MDHNIKLTTPHAGVIIWNYSDRINASGGKDVHKIDEIIISSSSLISISTSKKKGAPAGAFEFYLAPTHNWVSRITPGSWCVLLMSQNKPIPRISSDDPGSADPDLVKMLGRIHDVRVAIEVDQETGARRTMYVVTGQDWCSVFDTSLYIDPIARNNILDRVSPIGHSQRIGMDDLFKTWTEAKSKFPTSSNVISAIIKIWGSALPGLAGAISSALSAADTPASNPLKDSPTLQASSESQFKLPIKVAQYMGMGDLLGGFTGSSVNFADLIVRYDGVLTDYDEYSGDNDEAEGYPQPDSFYKMNTFWQMMVDNSNPIINELVTDLRWEGRKARLALYKRVKPFLNRKNFDGSGKTQVKKNKSYFSNIRCIPIPLEDIVSVNAGTNWRDKFNFVEIRPSQQLDPSNLDVQMKTQAQVTDRPAYEREGFKPLMQSVYYMPRVGEVFSPVAALEWKYLLKEWYFNTHLMLNGSMSIIGQNTYIQVGDNIQVDASLFGPSDFNSLQSGSTFVTAHVESVSHRFTVDPNSGARSFITTLQFVRGVITNSSGEILGSKPDLGGFDNPLSDTSSFNLGGFDDPLDGALDRDASSLETSQVRDGKVFGVPTETNPNDNDDELMGD